ncbi:MAG: cytochrome c [Woeseiaceae bacterium]|nr:cytochrome c [Woeseiaceae bacterium]
MNPLKKLCILFVALAAMPFAIADDDDPRHERHELMEGVRDAAKPVGAMLKGEREYDADVVMASLQTWHDASMKFGGLFPEGSESGMDTEAAPAIWEDREGFEAALLKWREAVEAAQAARPMTLEAAKPTVGPVFQTCKGCHDTYRIED